MKAKLTPKTVTTILASMSPPWTTPVGATDLAIQTATFSPTTTYVVDLPPTAPGVQVAASLPTAQVSAVVASDMADEFPELNLMAETFLPMEEFPQTATFLPTTTYAVDLPPTAPGVQVATSLPTAQLSAALAELNLMLETLLPMEEFPPAHPTSTQGLNLSPISTVTHVEVTTPVPTDVLSNTEHWFLTAPLLPTSLPPAVLSEHDDLTTTPTVLPAPTTLLTKRALQSQTHPDYKEPWGPSGPSPSMRRRSGVPDKEECKSQLHLCGFWWGSILEAECKARGKGCQRAEAGV